MLSPSSWLPQLPTHERRVLVVSLAIKGNPAVRGAVRNVSCSRLASDVLGDRIATRYETRISSPLVYPSDSEQFGVAFKVEEPIAAAYEVEIREDNSWDGEEDVVFEVVIPEEQLNGEHALIEGFIARRQQRDSGLDESGIEGAPRI